MKLNIRTRLAIQFTCIVSSLILLFSVIIYYFSATHRESEFYSRLKTKAVNTAKLLIEVQEVDKELLKIIDKNTINALYNEKVIIYDYKDQMIYNSLDDDSVHVSKSLLDKIRLKKEVRYHEGKYEVIGLLYTDRFDRFVVISSAFDKFGRSKLNHLKWILISGLFISVGLTILLGRIYSSRAIKPISDVVKQVDRITAANLHTRVEAGNGNDEIAQLAITFNQMLERLASSFEMQRSFVSNASHELKTPLTSILAQIEVSLMNQRTAEDYKVILTSILDDIKNLSGLSNGLLNLAKASSDASSISLHEIRIDELLWETKSDLTVRKNDYRIFIQFDDSIDDDKKFSVMANDHLLKTAFSNLMDNACKYSLDKSVRIILSAKDNYLIIRFLDNGLGISTENLDKIFQPFYRGDNVKTFAGHGLGLSLTEKIIHLHKGTILIDSELNKGTTVTLSVPILT